MHVQSDVAFKSCAQTVEGGLYCGGMASAHGWVAVGLSTLLDANGGPLPTDARVTLITFSREGAGLVAMEVAGLSLSVAEAPKPIADESATAAGCSCETGPKGTAVWPWLLLMVALVGVRRR
ncbi:MAG: MYXO-CTERM sorting domain-containing protein [Nannocystaceae bacterium]|nr:MYXO-CTERM sorting domain-containing protein [Nannocystaceae bacterium]